MNTETLTWRPASELTDVDVIVLIHAPEAAEPVWPAWWDGELWVWAEGAEVHVPVRAWAQMPEGPPHAR